MIPGTCTASMAINFFSASVHRLSRIACYTSVKQIAVHVHRWWPLDHCRCVVLTTIVIRLQSAASQSQHVVNILTSGDPVNAGDVDKVEADERNNNSTGLLSKGGPTAKIQVSVTLVVASPAAVLVQMSVSSTTGVACCHWSSCIMQMYLQVSGH